MAKDPAFLFYSQDFTTGTQFFSDEQTGKFIRLICAQHQHGHLPEKHMLSICKSHDEDVFAKFKIDEEGRYYNERLEFEINKRKAYTESRRNNAQHPKNQKNKKRKAYAKHMDGHMENEIEIENEIINEFLMCFKEGFLDTWKRWIKYKWDEHKQRYKKTESHLQAARNLIKISGKNEEAAVEIINHSIGSHYKGLFPLTKSINGSNQKPTGNNSDRVGRSDINDAARANY